MEIKDLSLGTIYKRKSLFEIFGNYYDRGIIFSKKTNSILLISDQTGKSPYGDTYFNDGILLYTGEGQKGDQTLTSAGNKAIADNNKPMYLFLKFKPGEYTYYGRVYLSGTPISVTETNEFGSHKVYKFPLSQSYNTILPLTNEQMEHTVVGGSIRSESKPHYQIVSAIIINKDKVLCAQIKDGFLKGKFKFPGGTINSGESVESTIKKAVKENVNLEIEIIEKIDTADYEYDKCSVSLTAYECKIKSGTLKSDHYSKLDWIPIDKLETIDFSGANKPIAESCVETHIGDIDEKISLNYYKAEAIEKQKRNPKDIEQDFEKYNKSKAKSGDRAEKSVVVYERDKLNNLKRPDLAAKVEQISKRGNQYGYDVLSYAIIDGNVTEIHIEVKVTRMSKEYIEFFISDHELELFKSDPNYKIYCLIKFGKNYKLHEVKKSDFFAHNYADAISYRVRIKISENC